MITKSLVKYFKIKMSYLAYDSIISFERHYLKKNILGKKMLKLNNILGLDVGYMVYIVF